MKIKIKDAIAPDVMPFVSVRTVEIEERQVVEVDVSTGTNRPYYLREKGLKPNRVYVRKGSSSQPVTDEGIREMIIQNNGKSYENGRSMNQSLTFETLSYEMKRRSIEFGTVQMRTLKLTGEDGLYTNLAYLLSDQCEMTTKAALLQRTDKAVFRDRKEFTGSVLKQLEDVYQFIDLNNKTKAVFSGLELKSIFLGVSQSRNSNLAAVLYRMKLIESYGTGIGKIQRMYHGFETAQGVFRITLPNCNEMDVHTAVQVLEQTRTTVTESLLKKQKDRIAAYAVENGQVTRKEVEELLEAGTTKAFRLLRELCDEGRLKAEGSGKLSRYVPG